MKEKISFLTSKRYENKGNVEVNKNVPLFFNLQDKISTIESDEF